MKYQNSVQIFLLTFWATASSGLTNVCLRDNIMRYGLTTTTDTTERTLRKLKRAYLTTAYAWLFFSGFGYDWKQNIKQNTKSWAMHTSCS